MRIEDLKPGMPLVWQPLTSVSVDVTVERIVDRDLDQVDVTDPDGDTLQVEAKHLHPRQGKLDTSQVPDDFHRYSAGIYLAASEPKVIWFAPKEYLISIGEEPTPEMIGATVTGLQGSYGKDGIELRVLEELSEADTPSA